MPSSHLSDNHSAPRRLVLLALLLACVGGAARFWDLGRMVVWHDEVFSVIRVLGFGQGMVDDALYGSQRILHPADLLRYQTPDPSRGWGDTWRALTGHPEHGPLFYLLARIGVDLLQPLPAIVGVRATSALLGLLLLPAMAWLARELFGRGAAPWIAVALVAVAPIHLLYAQEGRQYALWSALAAAASAALLRALRRGGGRDWTLYSLLIGLGLYTHLLTLLLLGIHALYGLWREHRDRAALRAAARGFVLASAGAALLFLPWVVVILDHWRALHNYTGWMAIPATLGHLMSAWGAHLNRPFLDLPELSGPWLLVVPVLLAVAAWYARRGADVRLLWLMAAVPLAMVALPDLILGGRRSLESRYLMPSFLALELLVAGALGRAWSGTPAQRRLAAGVLTLVLAAGLASQARILAADNWWNKSYSGRNWAFARVVNAAPRPLLLVGVGPVNLGESISLAYRLAPRVRLLLLSGDAPVALPNDVDGLFALLPGANLRRQLSPDYDFRPFPGTWQWFSLVPRAGAGETGIY